MRIISDFQDYYDSALALGSDSTRIYHRRSSTEELKTDKAPEPWSGLIAYDMHAPISFFEVSLRSIFVCFCGKVYPALQMPGSSPDAVGREEIGHATFYDSQSAYDAIRARAVEELKTGLLSLRREKSLKQSLTKFFSLRGSSIIERRLVDDKIAVAILMPGYFRSTLVVNARLADVQFYKAIDAWTAFQELDMFWGGVLAPESKPAPPVAEKDRLFKHGFDQKSFRKLPSKRRR